MSEELIHLRTAGLDEGNPVSGATLQDHNEMGDHPEIPRSWFEVCGE